MSGGVAAVRGFAMRRRLCIASGALATLVVAAAAVAATSGWKVQRSPEPSGAIYSTLGGVSCSSRSACTAVGQYTTDRTTYSTLAETWNGKKWSIEQSPTPGGAYGDLLGVSCAGANACMAVGYYQTTAPGVALAERWNGKKWSLLHPTIPAGARASGFYGVSCTSSRACTAVGYVDEASVYVTLVETWNGTRWSIAHTPNPPHSELSELNAVACTSGNACTAVGEWTQNGGAPTMAFAERLHGGKWSIDHAPHPTGAIVSEFKGVSCVAPNTCTATGDYEKKPNQSRTLAEGFNGRKWSIQHTPNPTSDANKYLFGVSCTAANACTAAGYTLGNVVWDTTIVEHWNGHKWSVQRSPSPGSDSDLTGVSCSSTSDCAAAGWYEKTNTGPTKTLIERR